MADITSIFNIELDVLDLASTLEKGREEYRNECRFQGGHPYAVNRDAWGTLRCSLLMLKVSINSLLREMEKEFE